MPDDINAAADASQVRMLDANAEGLVLGRIDEAKAAGNTLGGICEVVTNGLPAGLGSHVSWTASSTGALPRPSCPFPR
jgi:chorismate synthase